MSKFASLLTRTTIFYFEDFFHFFAGKGGGAAYI